MYSPLQAFAAKPLSQADIVQHTDLTNRTAFGLVQACLEAQVRRIGAGFGSEGERPLLSGALCASVHGFSLHANTQVPAHRRDQLERLIRYTARGAVSLERLEQDGNFVFDSISSPGLR